MALEMLPFGTDEDSFIEGNSFEEIRHERKYFSGRSNGHCRELLLDCHWFNLNDWQLNSQWNRTTHLVESILTRLFVDHCYRKSMWNFHCIPAEVRQFFSLVDDENSIGPCFFFVQSAPCHRNTWDEGEGEKKKRFPCMIDAVVVKVVDMQTLVSSFISVENLAK